MNSRARSQQGMTLIEVVVAMTVLAVIMVPLLSIGARVTEDWFRSQRESTRLDSYSRSAYLLTSGLAQADLPLRQGYDDQIEYVVQQDDGPRHVMMWKECSTNGGAIYGAVSAPRQNLIPNPSFETAWAVGAAPAGWTLRVNGDEQPPGIVPVTPPLPPTAVRQTSGAPSGGSYLELNVTPGRPSRPSYAWLESQVFTANPGTRYLVGAWMAEAVSDTDVKRRPRVEWFWTRSVAGQIQVLPERSGALTTPDRDDDTPDSNLNSASTNFSSWRWKITRPAPPGADGIMIRLTPGLITGSPADSAKFDGIMLQPMSASRINGSHAYFDGSTGAPSAYTPALNAPVTGAAWQPYWSGAANLSSSFWGSSSFAGSWPSTAADQTLSGGASDAAGIDRQLLFELSKADCDSYTSAPAAPLFEYRDASGALLPSGNSRLNLTREITLNIPVFGRNQAQLKRGRDRLHFAIGGLRSPQPVSSIASTALTSTGATSSVSFTSRGDNVTGWLTATGGASCTVSAAPSSQSAVYSASRLVQMRPSASATPAAASITLQRTAGSGSCRLERLTGGVSP